MANVEKSGLASISSGRSDELTQKIVRELLANVATT
jgi:hypothetical protein